MSGCKMTVRCTAVRVGFLRIVCLLFVCDLLVWVVMEGVDFVVVYGGKCTTRISSRYRDVHYE